MINLGEAPEQKEGGKGPVPPKSIVKVKLEIRQPKKPDPNDQAVTVFKSSLKGLDCELTVVSGRFEGVRIWENWFLPAGMQTIALKDGQKKMCGACHAKMRAVVEAARGLDPADPAANRSINSWFDLNGLEFPVKVEIDTPKPGDLYLNNNVAKVITMADEHYKEVMAGGEFITDNPLPEIPQGGNGSQGPPAGGGWNAGNGQVSEPMNGGTGTPPHPAESSAINVPAWAK